MCSLKCSLLLLCVFLTPTLFLTTTLATGADRSLSMIVMDPLAAPLSCPCVEGYAQRKYEKLAEHLQQELDRDVQLVFAESLARGLKETNGTADLIIGKDSVVRADASAANLEIRSVLQLTDKTGSVQQCGLIVVNKDDPARETKDLNGYTIIFGPSEAAEKHASAIALLKAAGVSIPEKVQIDEACSDGACKVIDLGPESKSAAVISSYAQPLLEGCGTVKKGDLRVVGETKPVPFVTAFVNETLSDQSKSNIKAALLKTNQEPELLDALESLMGFLEVQKTAEDQTTPAEKKKT